MSGIRSKKRMRRTMIMRTVSSRRRARKMLLTQKPRTKAEGALTMPSPLLPKPILHNTQTHCTPGRCSCSRRARRTETATAQGMNSDCLQRDGESESSARLPWVGQIDAALCRKDHKRTISLRATDGRLIGNLPTVVHTGFQMQSLFANMTACLSLL